MKEVTKKYYSNDDIARLTLAICKQIELSDWKPDIIVGISRGGLLPGVMISHYFDLPFQALQWSARDHVQTEHNSWLAEDASHGRRILIIDDICDSGQTLSEIKTDWEVSVRNPIAWGKSTKFACLHTRLHTNTFKLDYCGEEIHNDDWIVYPFENWWLSCGV